MKHDMIALAAREEGYAAGMREYETLLRSCGNPKVADEKASEAEHSENVAAALRSAHAALAARDGLRMAVEWFLARRAPIQAKFDLYGPEDTAAAMREAFDALAAALKEMDQ